MTAPKLEMPLHKCRGINLITVWNQWINCCSVLRPVKLLRDPLPHCKAATTIRFPSITRVVHENSILVVNNGSSTIQLFVCCMLSDNKMDCSTGVENTCGRLWKDDKYAVLADVWCCQSCLVQPYYWQQQPPSSVATPCDMGPITRAWLISLLFPDKWSTSMWSPLLG